MDFKIFISRRLYFSILILFTTNTFSQCFEIQSILVDACNGTAEGLNEMARFKVGGAPLNTNTLTVVWPNNSWQGVVQNATTASVVAQLNTEITNAGGCGQILEPPGGIIPANAPVILLTSYNMNTSANSFASLSETIYMIFQNAVTPVGHFSNYTNVPPNNRTFSMTFGTGCSDSVVYDKSILIRQNGTPGAEDGATVNFTPAGVATYTNTGCKAPTPPFTVDAGPVNLNVCAGATISLNGTAVGQQFLLWSSPSGVFSSNSTASTNYTIPPEAGGTTIVLTLEATNNCGLKITDAINLSVAANTIPDFATALTLCALDSAPILSNTSPNGITGTWSPAVISATAGGNYTFTPTAGQCASTVTLAVTITPETIPDFATALTLCALDTAPALAATSPNGISGTWSPAVINTTADGNYTFTPTAGQCASSVTLAVTITPETIPDFATALTLCALDTAPALAATSPNGISGTWSPAVISTTANGNYTFTPTAGQCASNVNLAVTITPETIPDFATALTLCALDTAPILSNTPPNGITGTWSPAVISTTADGNYTFTPTAGQCASSVTLAVTITPETIPDFATALTLCALDSAPALAATSPNGITGTWSPAVISKTANGNYTFTPTAGQCASSVTLAVTITPEKIPDFATTLILCSNSIAPILSNTSPNGITGTWSPAVVSNTTDNIYVFTPNQVQCAKIATLAVIITSDITPDFLTTLNLCSTDTAPVLATKSPNGITGTWNPVLISTANSGNYIFTPTSGQCAKTIILLVTIKSAITPDFITTLTLCTGDTVPALATTSPNGIKGTWNPGVINTTTSANYTFTPNVGQCAKTAILTVNTPSPTYSITQECIKNKYLLKVISNSNLPSSDYTLTWINEKGVQVGYNTSVFNFSEYIETLNDKPTLPLQFKVIVGNGSCEIEETFTITNNLCGVPNAISPNGDGVNDTFDLSSLNVNDLTVFNRYGREVYHFSGKYENQWNGQWKDGRLPMGTYFYIISRENGESRAGWVFLLY